MINGKTIALCMIAKNEQKRIGRAINSFADIADEIIVVDTGSNDKTKNIARKAGATVFDLVWSDDFSAARNISFSFAVSDFILWSDCDDWTTAQEIDKMRALDLDQWGVVAMPYQYDAQTVVLRERLIRRSIGATWEKRIHETLKIPDGSRCYYLHAWIYHDKKGNSFERNMRILQASVKDDPDDARYWYDLAREYVGHGDYDDAERWASACLDRSDRFVPIQLWHCEYIRGLCAAHEHKDSETIAHMLAAIGRNLRRVEPYFALARYYQEHGDFPLAIQLFRFCLSVNADLSVAFFDTPAMRSWMSHQKLAECYAAAGDLRLCVAHIDAYLRYMPGDKAARESREKFVKILRDEAITK